MGTIETNFQLPTRDAAIPSQPQQAQPDPAPEGKTNNPQPAILQESDQQKAEDAKRFQDKMDEIAKEIAAMNTSMPSLSMQLKVDDRTHDTYITVMDQSTGEVIKEVPTADFRNLKAKMHEIAGMIIDKRS